MSYLIEVLFLLAVWIGMYILVDNKHINPAPGFVIVICISLIAGIKIIAGSVLMLAILYVLFTPSTQRADS